MKHMIEVDANNCIECPCVRLEPLYRELYCRITDNFCGKVEDSIYSDRPNHCPIEEVDDEI